jgi:energy-coupling factor transport system permease protein
MIDNLFNQQTNSKFQQLDPRVRIFWALIISVLALLWSTPIPLFLVILTFIPVWLYSNQIKQSLTSSLRLIPYLAFLFVLQLIIKFLFGQPQTDYLIQFQNMGVSQKEIVKASVETLRFFIMLQAAQLILKTTNFGELTSAIRQSIPDLGNKSHQIKEAFTFIIGTSYQSIPLLGKEINQVVEVQKARGVEIKQGNKIQQVKKISRLGMPLFIRCLELTKSSGLALLNFGFSIKNKRSIYRRLSLTKTDWSVLGLLIFLLVLVGVIKFKYPYL